MRQAWFRRHVALVSLSSLAIVIGSSSSARAEVLEDVLVCAGTAETFYDPGLLLTSRETEISWVDTYSACLPNDHDIGSGITEGFAISEISCLSLLGEESGGSQRIDWDTDEYSIMTWTSDDVVISGALGTQIYTVNAVVTEGLFLDSRVTEVIALTTPSLLGCLAEPGVTTTGGVVSLIIQSEL